MFVHWYLLAHHPEMCSLRSGCWPLDAKKPQSLTQFQELHDLPSASLLYSSFPFWLRLEWLPFGVVWPFGRLLYCVCLCMPRRVSTRHGFYRVVVSPAMWKATIIMSVPTRAGMLAGPMLLPWWITGGGALLWAPSRHGGWRSLCRCGTMLQSACARWRRQVRFVHTYHRESHINGVQM